MVVLQESVTAHVVVWWEFAFVTKSAARRRRRARSERGTREGEGTLLQPRIGMEASEPEVP